MKKALCGTTALVAAGLSAGQALADGGIKLDISGYYRAAAGVLIGGDQVAVSGVTKSGSTAVGGLGDFGRTSGGFRQEIRINFSGDFTLPDGITVAAFVGLNPGGTRTTTELNRAYVDFKGQYGDLRFGQGDAVDVIKEDCVYDPGNVTSNFGINSANQNFTNAGLGNLAVGGVPNSINTVGVATFETAAATCLTFIQKGTSITYFSPAFAGFTFGVTYTPSGGTSNASGSQGFGAGTDFKNSQAENILSVAGDYNADLGGGWTFLAGGGGQWAFSGHTTGGGSESKKPSAYTFGFQVANPNGWTVGASGEYMVNYPNFAGTFAATDAGTSGADGWVAAVGGAYTVGNWSFGLQGIYSRYQVQSNTTHDAIWGVGVNGAYTLGPGVTLEGQVAYSKYDPGSGTPSISNPMSYDAVELDAGIAINF